MPAFPERESSILAKLKKKKGPRNLPDIDDVRRNVNGSTEHSENAEEAKKVTITLIFILIWNVFVYLYWTPSFSICSFIALLCLCIYTPDRDSVNQQTTHICSPPSVPSARALFIKRTINLHLHNFLDQLRLLLSAYCAFRLFFVCLFLLVHQP